MQDIRLMTEEELKALVKVYASPGQRKTILQEVGKIDFITTELHGISVILSGLAEQFDDENGVRLSDAATAAALDALSAHLERIEKDLDEIPSRVAESLR